MITALASIYRTESSARQFLDRAGFPAHRAPSWQATSPVEFWREIAWLVEHGIIEDGCRAILRLALDDWPGNPSLRRAWDARPRDRSKKLE